MPWSELSYAYPVHIFPAVSLVVHVRSGEKEEAVGVVRLGVGKLNVVRGGCDERKVREHQCSGLCGELMEILRCRW